MRSALVGLLICGGLTLSPAAVSVQSPSATNARTFTDARLGLTAVAADLTLPGGPWEIASVSPPDTLDQLFLIPRALAGSFDAGRRVSAAQVQRFIETGRWRVQQFYAACVDYARTNAGIGPGALTDLDPARFGYLVESFAQSGWAEDRIKPAPGPYFFLMPATPIPPSAGSRPPSTSRTPLVLELRPYINDGKHWVLFADGSVDRVAVDQALLARYKLTLRPVRTDSSVTGTPDPMVAHSVHALLRAGATGPVTLTLADAAGARRLEVRWTLAGARSDPQTLADWALAREHRWLPLVTHGDAPILRAWLARTPAVYGESDARRRMSAPEDLFRQMQMEGRDPRTTGTFDVLGGRAALRETLQLELLRTDRLDAFAPPDTPIASVRGVDVVSLPFETMLAGRPGGRLPLADHVPADRLLIYFSKPAALFPFLDKGGDFLARAGSVYTASAFDDDLKARYLRRLGLGERAGRAFIEAGGVTEVALVASDLFFVDGTDVTILMRVKSPELVATGLRLLGVADVAAQGMTEKSTSPGRSAFWARQGDLLMVGTSRKEVEQILQLGSTTNADSLGRSAELRYMLTELPVNAETRALVYLSDPFIRRMVGPAVKIGQLRRMRARADMLMITSGALLYRLDGRRDVPTLARLVDLGYVPNTVAASRYTLRDDFSAASSEWGTLADMTPIDTSSITLVTMAEAQAYGSYRNEYTQYWRQFFDPIAMRLDDAPNGELELSTFVLPLIDSELYNVVRGVLQAKEGGKALRVPVLTPEPVAQVSLNLTEDAWIGLSGSFSQEFSRFTGISAELFDLLGPGLHVAIQDADPILAVGTGDVLGAFGSPLMGPRFDVFMPIALSVLTRPCKFLIELQDPPRALEMLRRATTRSARPPSLRSEGEFRQIEGRDAWVFTFGVPGIITARLGVEIQNGFLVLSNTPWTRQTTVRSAGARLLNGATIRVAPDAVKEGLAGLFATQAEHDQMAALSSMSALLPLLQTVSATPAEAATRHAALFGSRPLHPKTGDWVWSNGRLESNVYGSPTQWKMPLYKPEIGGFGLFDGTALLDLNMQFETGGLRAVARWKWKD